MIFCSLLRSYSHVDCIPSTSNPNHSHGWKIIYIFYLLTLYNKLLELHWSNLQIMMKSTLTKLEELPSSNSYSYPYRKQWQIISINIVLVSSLSSSFRKTTLFPFLLKSNKTAKCKCYPLSRLPLWTQISLKMRASLHRM